MSDSEGTSLQQKILGALSEIQDPDLGKDIVALGFVKNIIIKKNLVRGADVSLEIELTTPACPFKLQFKNDAERLIRAIAGVSSASVVMTANVKRSQASGMPSLAGVKNVIAVGSGKGGVGKSTVAVNLAFALKQLGSRVGLLDADVHGPSLGMMLGLKGMPEVKNGKVVPKLAFGMPCMSFSFFSPVGEAVIWRGAMTAKAVEQMLFDVQWSDQGADGDLDYLIIDMPPGTGDIPLTLIHKIHVDGAVVVSTPQDLALLDATKAFFMYEKLKVPVLGLIENMSGFHCPHCSKPIDIFGSGGARREAEFRKIPFLGAIALDSALVKNGDSGTPMVVADPKSVASLSFLRAAEALAQQLSIAQRSALKAKD